MRPAAVRFYFDADVLGLAKVVCSLRPDCTFPGDPGAEIQRRPSCLSSHVGLDSRQRMDSGRGQP